MREILFRGRRKDNGEWVYGSLLYAHECYHIVPKHTNANHQYEIVPETIGQYTDAIDRFGEMIFEGDILEGMGTTSVVYFDTDNCRFDWEVMAGDWRESFSGWADEYAIIGNIHDKTLEKIDHDSLCETETWKVGDAE